MLKETSTGHMIILQPEGIDFAETSAQKIWCMGGCLRQEDAATLEVHVDAGLSGW